MTCDRGQLDGAYVLGALSPTERLEFEQHLAHCADCSRSVRELAGLPGLLAQVDLRDLEASDVPPVPASLLPRLVGDVRRAQRRRIVVTATMAAGLAAAVASLAVAGLSSTGILGRGGTLEAGPGASPTPSASSTVASLPMAAVGSSRVRADVRVADVAWGTRLDLTCSYASDGAGYEDERGPLYALVIRTRSGATEQVATWRALPGRTMQVSAATATDRAEISSLEMRTATDSVVLRLTL